MRCSPPYRQRLWQIEARQPQQPEFLARPEEIRSARSVIRVRALKPAAADGRRYQ
jgi:hypothetical protein